MRDGNSDEERKVDGAEIRWRTQFEVLLTIVTNPNEPTF